MNRRRHLEAKPSGETRGALLLIHAFPLNARMWEPQFSLCDEGWHVIAPHLRGFDGDPGPNGAARSMDDYAGDLEQLLDDLHLDKVVVGGLSLGGYVAFALWRRAPERFAGLILSDTRAEADTAEAREGRTRMLATLRDEGPAAVADQMIPKLLGDASMRAQPDLVERVRHLILSNDAAGIGAAVTAMMTRPDSTELLGAITCPTLVLVGELDALTPPSIAERLQRAIPGARRTVIAGAGHVPNLEEPAAFNAAVAGFLREI